MFKINRKEYVNMIDALGELQDILEKERETQQLMAKGSVRGVIGTAGMAMRKGLSMFLDQGVYERAYQQCKKIKESMESLLPLVTRLLWQAESLATDLEETISLKTFLPDYGPYSQPGTEIFMLDESYVNSIKQGCDDLVVRGRFLKNQMQAAINKCAGIIDCSAEQAAINKAEKSVLRIADFKEAFQSYVIGVRDLDESLRMDFTAFADEEDMKCGKPFRRDICTSL